MLTAEYVHRTNLHDKRVNFRCIIAYLITLGMSCFQLKGGIGSSSRKIEISGHYYHVGALVLSNFGLLENLIVGDVRNAGKIIEEHLNKERLNESEQKPVDNGSIIIVLATDIPLNERQLKRISKRAVVGLSRTGSFIGSGSGDIVIAFTTANIISHYQKECFLNFKMINENEIDIVFQAVAGTVEESILNSMICSKPAFGKSGHVRRSLFEYIHLLNC